MKHINFEQLWTNNTPSALRSGDLGRVVSTCSVPFARGSAVTLQARRIGQMKTSSFSNQRLNILSSEAQHMGREKLPAAYLISAESRSLSTTRLDYYVEVLLRLGALSNQPYDVVSSFSAVPTRKFKYTFYCFLIIDFTYPLPTTALNAPFSTTHI